MKRASTGPSSGVNATELRYSEVPATGEWFVGVILLVVVGGKLS